MLRMPACIHLATGILVRDGRLLMVASHYPNQALPLWNLPGGRQLPGELLEETVAREVFEETGLRVEVRELAYVSESYDGDVHFISIAFRVEPAPSEVEGRAEEEGVLLRVTSRGTTLWAWTGWRSSACASMSALRSYASRSWRISRERCRGIMRLFTMRELRSSGRWILREPRGPTIVLQRVNDHVDRLTLHRGPAGQRPFVFEAVVT